VKIQRLAIRALNDYNRRSSFTYLALRYALEACSVRKDRWAIQIAPEILSREERDSYLVNWFFKDYYRGKFVFRKIGGPGSNEALAEAALLDVCAQTGEVFAPKKDVFSYRLSKKNSLEGSFQRYFDNYKRRQRAIGRCCRKYKSYIVLYADIKNFYPSVSRSRARGVWKVACAQAKLPARWARLGEYLIDRQKVVSPKGLLVGPMFSHLIADLSLRDFDAAMRRSYQGNYFRYVDDIALVIPAAGKTRVKRRMTSLLKSAGLKLHPGKFAEMRASEWAEKAPWQGKPTVIEDRDKKWVALIDRVKCYLIKKPEKFDALSDALREVDLRIPLPKYQLAISDADYVERLKRRMRSKAFLRYVNGLTRRKIVNRALRASRHYMEEFSVHWSAYGELAGMEKKWHGTRVKGLLGKLTMLAPETLFPGLVRILEGHPEFAGVRAIFKAIQTNDVSDLVLFGGSICGAAGQVLATRGKHYRCEVERWSKAAAQGYATLCLMGVDIATKPPLHVSRRFEARFAHGGYGAGAWRTLGHPFARDVVAISKEVSLEKNQRLMHSPMNPDDEWVLLSDELNMPLFSP
jgi:hypothetical protein